MKRPGAPRKLLNLLAMDMRNGLRSSMLVVPPLFCMGAIMAIGQVARARSTFPHLAFSVPDIVLRVLMAAETPINPPPDLVINRDTELPFIWVIALALILMASVIYPLRDLRGIGAQALVASGSRRSWWLAKCIWVVVTSIGAYASMLAGVVIATLLLGGEASLDLSPVALQAGRTGFASVRGLSDGFAGFLGLSFLALACLSIIQLLVSFAWGPMAALGGAMVLLCSSHFVRSPLLVGNYLMALRSGLLDRWGTPWGIGVVSCLIQCGVCLLVGCCVFSRTDIFDRDSSW